jgi:hypothetical protein
MMVLCCRDSSPGISSSFSISSSIRLATGFTNSIFSITRTRTRTRNNPNWGKRPEQPISRILSPIRVTPNQATIIHLWKPVARHLLRPTRELGRATLKSSPIWSCTGWGLPSFPGHPENWCALTAPFHPYPAPDRIVWYRAVYFLLHFPSRRRDFTL